MKLGSPWITQLVSIELRYGCQVWSTHVIGGHRSLINKPRIMISALESSSSDDMDLVNARYLIAAESCSAQGTFVALTSARTRTLYFYAVRSSEGSRCYEPCHWTQQVSHIHSNCSFSASSQVIHSGSYRVRGRAVTRTRCSNTSTRHRLTESLLSAIKIRSNSAQGNWRGYVWVISISGTLAPYVTFMLNFLSLVAWYSNHATDSTTIIC